MKEVNSSYIAKEIEQSVRSFWDQQQIYSKLKKIREGGEDYFFVDGPPYTTGYIHLGTAWNKILKDSILRHVRMGGKNIIERAGYDMHGLPIEVRVENELGFRSKKDIENYGISAFIERCRNFAITHKDIMSDQFRALGIWMDFENPYQTITTDYIEAAWWALARADEKGLLEQGSRVVNWCPRCETAIADSEVEYADSMDPSIFVKFPLLERDDEYLVIWTTTPWTLPANVAVAVQNKFKYARVKGIKEDKSEILWIAEDLVESVLRKGRYTDYVVMETVYGSDLVGTKYTSPLTEKVPRQADLSHVVINAEFVTLENTGLVHIAPGHGWDDYLVGLENGLEVFCPVAEDGCFTEDAGIYADMYVKDANEIIIDDLVDALLARETIEHRYGHCWRCKTPIIYRATEQWFLRISDIRNRMLREIDKVTWYPEWAGSARFHDFVADSRDWCISRQRYWGIPIPVWICGKCGSRKVFGTIPELEEASGKTVKNPHRPYVDDIVIPCTCGGDMKRVEDIFDVWFDSAVASWATLGFPASNDAFEKYWPADFITEGQDQTRGWFYSQLGASTIAFDRAPYKKVLMHGFALDAEGRKMSKSFGNVVTPEVVVESVGVDVMRLYILSASAPWDDLKFNWEGVKTTNKAVNILWNVYRFPLPYMILDNFSPAATGGIWENNFINANLDRMPAEDRWIFSRVCSILRNVNAEMDVCNLHKATRSIIDFILEDLSRWYVQLVRSRMWKEEENEDKRFAYETIYAVMRHLTQAMAPFMPHLSDEIYRNLKLENDPESVHLQLYPDATDRFIDGELEEKMGIVRSFDESVANARQTGKRKLRWPVSGCTVVTSDRKVVNAINDLNDLCKARANAREVSVVEGKWDRLKLSAVPVMRAIGPGFGKDAPKIRAIIEEADGDQVKRSFETKGEIEIEGFTLLPEHIEFEEGTPEGIFSSVMEGGIVYVDVNLNPDLKAEGYSRELIRRIQEMRRQMDLNIEDFIISGIYTKDSTIADLITGKWPDLIKSEVRAQGLEISTEKPDENEWSTILDWEIEGVSVTIGIRIAN